MLAKKNSFEIKSSANSLLKWNIFGLNFKNQQRRSSIGSCQLGKVR